MKVRVLIKTVISGHWLSVGDVYEGTEEELRLYLDSGFVEPIGNPKVSEDSELSAEPKQSTETPEESELSTELEQSTETPKESELSTELEQPVASPKPVKPEKTKEEGKK